MKYIIWVVTPPNYIFSQCFFDQAYPLRDAFIELGHKCYIVTQAPEFKEENVVVLGAHLLDAAIPSHWIIYNLEQIQVGSPWMTDRYVSLLKNCQVWDYHKDNSSQLGISPKIIPVGYMPCMERISKVEPVIDVLHYGSMNERRHKIINQLIDSEVNVQQAFKVYGEIRDNILARTKLVLNISFYSSKIFNITRCAYLFANKIAVISESGPGCEEIHGACVFADYNELVPATIAALRDYEAIGHAGYEVFSKMRQTDYLREVL